MSRQDTTPVVTVEIEGEYGVIDGSIHILVDGRELVMWDSAEWVEDPSLVYVIANAIVTTIQKEA